MRHHELYEHVINYNQRMVKINLYFLFAIILLPLSTSITFGNAPEQAKLFIFFANLFLCNFLYYILLLIIFHKKNNFSSLQSKEKIDNMKGTGLRIIMVFFLVCVIISVDIKYFYFPFFILPLYRFYNWMKRKYFVKKASV